MAKRKKNIAYLRVSTTYQNNEKFETEILKFANDRNFGKVVFVKEIISGKKSWRDRKLKTIIDDLGKNDRLLIPELTRLGRSTLEVLEILKAAKEKDINVYAVKENLIVKDDMQSKVMVTMFSLFSELERDFISQRTKEGLKARKAQGVILGRPKGPGKSKLDQYKEEIIALMKTGSTKTYLAKKYNTTLPNFYNWLKKNDIKIKAEV